MKSKRWALAAVFVSFSFWGMQGFPAASRELDKAAVGAEKTPAESLQKLPPGIMFSTILNNVTVNARGGWFKLGNQMQNVFMPDGATGKVLLLRADGSQVCHWRWKLDAFGLRPPYQLFAFGQPLNPDGSDFDVSGLKLTRAGEYVLDFYLGETKFYTFSFRVRTLDPENSFDGETVYLTDGAWSDWGYLHYPDANPEQNLLWKVWLRDETYQHKGHAVRVEVIRDQDKKVICQNRENMTFNFRHDWVRYNFDLVNPPVKTSGGAYFKAKDLLGVDGSYTLRMTIDGKAYGVWKFRVTAGKLSYAGRTVRGEADPLTFVEGGKDAWWYMKQPG